MVGAKAQRNQPALQLKVSVQLSAKLLQKQRLGRRWWERYLTYLIDALQVVLICFHNVIMLLAIFVAQR
jgi:hypothetical protein